jgi:UDP-N-acetylmuramoylalanine--D-glutamate ligase
MTNNKTLQNQNVAIVGMGKSGQSATVLACLLGACVMCFDSRPVDSDVQEKLISRIRSLSSNNPNISIPSFHVGYPILINEKEYAELIDDEIGTYIKFLDLLILSPGVPASSHWLIELQNNMQRYHNTALKIASEVGFAASYTQTKMIAITGTNGKSSCSWYTYQYLSSLGYRCFVGGNFGTALSEMVIEELLARISDKIPYTYAVVEISSYQMEFPYGFSPCVGVALNLTPDHLARHQTMNIYAQMKRRIFASLDADAFCVYPLEDVRLHPTSTNAKHVILCQKKPQDDIQYSYVYTEEMSIGHERRIFYVDTLKQERFFVIPSLQLLGRHNIQNIQAVIAILLSLKQPIESHLLSSIRPLEHRLEAIKNISPQNVQWINDSKATNVEATQAGLLATVEYIQNETETQTKTLIVLLGGVGKEGANYRILLDCFKQLENRDINTKIICFGASGLDIMKQLQDRLLDDNLRVELQYVSTMSKAVTVSQIEVQQHHSLDKKKVVLLSPACASFDEFQNFEHRGRVFCEMVWDKQSTERKTSSETNLYIHTKISTIPEGT